MHRHPIQQIWEVQRELERLLQIPLRLGSDATTGQFSHIVERMLTEASDAWGHAFYTGDALPFQVIRDRLYDLAARLREIEQYDSNLLRRFQRDMAQQGDSTDFFGFRYEARTAAFAIKRGFDVSKRESPDLILSHSGDFICIECTSGRYTKDVDLSTPFEMSKIMRRIEVKMESAQDGNWPYQRRTILAIDITNVVHHHNKIHGETTSSSMLNAFLKYHLGLMMSDFPFGALVLEYFGRNHDRQQSGGEVLGGFHPAAEEVLFKLLPIMYPESDPPLDRYTVPEEG